MKKVYETPEVEKIAFQYRDQVVVASGRCIVQGGYSHYVGECDSSQAGAEYSN